MSTTGNTTNYYNVVHDPIYDLSKQPIAVDKDTIFKSCSVISAVSDGNANAFTTAGCLNSGKRTKFDFTMGSGTTKTRWDHMALKITKYWSTAAYADAAAVNFSPSPNGCINIEGIKLNINDSSIDLYNCT